MLKVKMMVKNYMGKFEEGNEFSLGHMMVLSLLATIPLGIALFSLKLSMQIVYTIFW